MVPKVPEEIRKLERICDPYIKACKLVSDAPEEVKEAKKKVDEWYEKAFRESELF